MASTAFKQTEQWLLRVVGAGGILFFSYLMLQIIVPYLTPPYPTDIDFLLTKRYAVRQEIWLVSFYVHITSSLLVMLAGAPQFSRSVLWGYPAFHRLTGKLYLGLILFLSAPTGFVMALYANGGWVGQTAFTLQSVLWWSFTALAYRSIIQGKIEQHGAWMLRSYALTLAAITLRVGIFLMGQLAVPLAPKEKYALVAWGSWTFNLLIAEGMIALGFLHRYRRIKNRG